MFSKVINMVVSLGGVGGVCILKQSEIECGAIAVLECEKPPRGTASPIGNAQPKVGVGPDLVESSCVLGKEVHVSVSKGLWPLGNRNHVREHIST